MEYTFEEEKKLLVKCYYKPAHYESIVAALKPHDATIHIAGEMTISRHDGKIECMSIEQFKKTSPRDPDERSQRVLQEVGVGVD